MGKQRVRIKESTIRKLFAVSGNRCAYPDCAEKLVGTGDIIGEVCHIRAASKNGPRYAPSQTEEDRNGYDNLILLCPNHHTITHNEKLYAVETLCKWKKDHEKYYRKRPKTAPKLTAKMIQEIIGRLTAPTLALVAPESRRPIDETELSLLNPYRQATTLVGRDDDLKKLLAWANSPRPIAVRTLIGRAGAGKTRLALKLMDDLQAQQDELWDVGFLTAEEMKRFRGKVPLGRWKWPRPTLAVVDYAAAVTEELRQWLKDLSNNREGKKTIPLRILLLEREASETVGWLKTLLPESYSEASVRELFDPLEPVALSPIEKDTDRRSLLVNMLNLCAKVRGTPAPTLPAPGVDKQFDQRLAEPQWADPLYLMMAAMVGIQTGVPQALALSRTDLGEKIASREIGRIERMSAQLADPTVAKRLMPLLAAVATLTRGLTREQAVQLAEDILGILHWNYPLGVGCLAEKLADILPDEHGEIAPILPDMVGEAFVYLAFTGGEHRLSGTQRDEIIQVAVSLGPGAIKTLILLAQDYAEQHGDILNWIDPLIHEGQSGNLGLLQYLSDQLPEQTLALMEKAAEISKAIVDGYWTMVEKNPSEQNLSQLAGNLNNLGNRLSALGRREEALEATKEAMDLHRKLAAQRPDAFLPDLAMSLNNLGLRLNGLGRREEALKATQEAVDIRRKLAAQRPDTFLPNLAMSLNNLGRALSELGRREEALKAAQEAVAIRRKLVAQQSDAFLPNLAASLNNMGNILSDLGRREEALKVAQEAVDICRRLTAQRPDAFLPNLAGSLNNLGRALSELGRLEEALKVAQEAVDICRRLTAQRPDAFLPNLAGSLNNLGAALSNVGRREEALAAAREATDLYRTLAAQRPHAFLPDLAMSLNNLGAMLSDLGRWEEALKAAQEAVAIRRKLAAQRPNAFLPDLVRSLGTLNICYRGLEQHTAAKKAIEEALRKLSPLFLRLPQAFWNLMVNVIGNYLQNVRACGEQPDMKLLGPIVEVLEKLESDKKVRPSAP
jgi:tetratricopeptide (TPR) repeat protein